MTSAYQQDLIKQGDESIAVIEKNGVIYRLEPMEIFQEIKFNDFVAGIPKEFDLSKYIDADYHILGWTVDMSSDNDAAADVSTIDSGEYGGNLEIKRIIDGKVRGRIRFGIHSGRVQFANTFLRHSESIRVTSSTDCDSITFICKPTILAKPIQVFGS